MNDTNQLADSLRRRRIAGVHVSQLYANQRTCNWAASGYDSMPLWFVVCGWRLNQQTNQRLKWTILDQADLSAVAPRATRSRWRKRPTQKAVSFFLAQNGFSSSKEAKYRRANLTRLRGTFNEGFLIRVGLEYEQGGYIIIIMIICVYEKETVNSSSGYFV